MSIQDSTAWDPQGYDTEENEDAEELPPGMKILEDGAAEEEDELGVLKKGALDELDENEATLALEDEPPPFVPEDEDDI